MSYLTDEEMTALALVFGAPDIHTITTSQRGFQMTRFRSVVSEMFPRLPREHRPDYPYVSIPLTCKIFVEYQAWYDKGMAGPGRTPAPPNGVTLITDDNQRELIMPHSG